MGAILYPPIKNQVIKGDRWNVAGRGEHPVLTPCRTIIRAGRAYTVSPCGMHSSTNSRCAEKQL